MIFIVTLTEAIMLEVRVQQDIAVRLVATRVEGIEEDLAALEPDETEQRERLEQRIEKTEATLEEARSGQAKWHRIHGITYLVRAGLPKTSETMGLLERSLISSTDLDNLLERTEQASGGPSWTTVHGERISERTIQRELNETVRDRPAWWLIGTSLLFEACILGLGAWRFCRRDF